MRKVARDNIFLVGTVVHNGNHGFNSKFTTDSLARGEEPFEISRNLVQGQSEGWQPVSDDASSSETIIAYS